MGVDAPPPPDVAGFRARHRLAGPYVLYAGRIDAGKGCAEMLAFYERFRATRGPAPELVLVGRMALPELRQPGVRYLGYVSEEDKTAAMAGARAVLCPSPYESLSIVLLEALAVGTPGLVSARSEVLTDHARRSNAALYYADVEEFVEALDLLARNDTLRDALGTNGRAYVAAEYRWDVVLERWRSLLRSIGE